jgi:arylsulfatase A-like enzyme
MLDALVAPSLPNSVGHSFLGLLAESHPGENWEDVAFSEYCSERYCPEGGCYQRMIRQAEWKLVYYHGQEPQLFNLEEDPEELVDRAQDPTCSKTRQELTQRVLDGWNPERIAVRMASKRADNQILRAWAERTRPADRFRWELVPEMNYLD